MNSTVSLQVKLLGCVVITRSKSCHLGGRKSEPTSRKSTANVMMDDGFELLILCVVVIEP